MTLFSPAEGALMLAAFGVLAYGVTRAAYRRRSPLTAKQSFLVADRAVGWRPASFSIAAAWIWAPALFVAAQQGYQHGWVGVFWFTVPNVACLLVFAQFAARMRERHPYGWTLSDYMRRLSPRVQRIYLVALGGLAVCSFAVQLLAGGMIVSTLTGIPYVLVTVALAAIALSYTLRSGVKASILTDWTQMAVIVAVVLTLVPWAVHRAGLQTVLDGLGGASGDFTSLTSGPGAGVFWSFGLSTTIGLLSGPFGDQSFWQRTWSIRHGEVRRAFTVGALLFAVVPLTMSLLGFAAAGAQLDVANPQLTNLSAVLHWLPEWTAVPFLVFILCGLVSTLDSNLASAASLAGHDATRWQLDAVRNGRLGMIGLAVAATALANVPGLTVVGLFIVYGTLRASTLAPTVLVLTRRTVAEAGVFWGVTSALAVGVPLSAYGNLTGQPPWIVAGSLTVLALSAGITLAASWRDRARGLTDLEVPPWAR